MGLPKRRKSMSASSSGPEYDAGGGDGLAPDAPDSNDNRVDRDRPTTFEKHEGLNYTRTLRLIESICHLLH